MKSRLALTLVLVAGFMLSTTGATLAISGSSGNGSAADNQYASRITKTAVITKKASRVPTGRAANDNKTLRAAEVQVEAAPTAEQQAVVSSGSTLPFTGFVAIPLLIIGVGLGSRRRIRSDQIAQGTTARL